LILLLEQWNYFWAESSNLKNLDLKRKLSKVSLEFAGIPRGPHLVRSQAIMMGF